MKKYLIFLFLVGMLFSCRTVPYLYYPNTLNMPLPRQEKEMKATILAGLDGYGVQGSYSIGQHLVVLGNCNAIFTGKFLDHLVSDIGAGYYTSLSKHANFEITGSAGYGFTNTDAFNIAKASFFGGSNNEYLNIYSSMYRGSIQMDLGFGGRNVEFAFGFRVTDMFFNGDYEALYFDKIGVQDSLKHMPLKGKILMFEPGISLSFGSQSIRFVTTAGFSTPLTDGMKVDSFYGPLYFPIYMTAGVHLHLWGGTFEPGNIY